MCMVARTFLLTRVPQRAAEEARGIPQVKPEGGGVGGNKPRATSPQDVLTGSL